MIRPARRVALIVTLVIFGATSASPASARQGQGAAEPSPTGGSGLTTGSDGRLTVLIAGSDYRPGYTSERTDVIMVVSLDPITHRAAAASIPRDTVHVPIAPANGGGNSGTDRINTLLWSYNRRSLPTLADRLTLSLGKFRADVALTLGVEIDYYAYLRFTGFNDLIDAVDGVSLDIPKTITDKNYNDYGTSPYGIHFPVASDYRLGGTTESICDSWQVDCTRALPYVRSRHGKVGTGTNSDYARAGRQQRFLLATALRVVSRGTGGELDALVAAMSAPDADPAAHPQLPRRLFTDMPTTVDAALALYDMLGATPAYSAKVVFQPSTWERYVTGDPIYTYRLRLGKVRAWVDDHMAPVPPASP